MARYLDFKQLRGQLRFANILQHYGVEYAERGHGQVYAFCPLPQHQRKEDAPRSPSFSANLERGIFQCFSCQGSGNLIEFAALMEGLNPREGLQFRKVALQLDRLFNGGQWSASQLASAPIGETLAPPAKSYRSIFKTAQSDQVFDVDKTAQTAGSQTPPIVADALANITHGTAHSEATSIAVDSTVGVEGAANIGTHADAATDLPTLVNAPLTFMLKDLDYGHSYLRDRGFTDATIEHFGLGACQRGSMQNRLVIPLMDDVGQLIGYAGRLIDDSKINHENPRYKFPSSREHKGQRLEFHKTLFLYQGHAIPDPVQDLIVVESFTAVWWLWQHGYAHAVALMGSNCSEQQAALIVQKTREGGCVWLMPDGDAAGAQCAAQSLVLLAPHRTVRLVKLGTTKESMQPTDLNADQLAGLLPQLAPH